MAHFMIVTGMGFRQIHYHVINQSLLLANDSRPERGHPKRIMTNLYMETYT
jgi:hypothetical protein